MPQQHAASVKTNDSNTLIRQNSDTLFAVMILDLNSTPTAFGVAKDFADPGTRTHPLLRDSSGR